ncbi:MAG TPA: hypothetical protein VJM82_01635 [Nitrospiraceae bacterium]|nr:hypothetical protein [Nitrospiraceae bacterium]
MTASQSPYAQVLRELAALMLAVAGESVTMVKHSAPDQALKLKKKQEWNIYLEFLKVMFNLADRLSAFHLPVQEQPLFMDGLEDAVAQQLKAVLEPALGPDSDEMELVITIGKAVSESRQDYERFRFVVTDEGKVKEEFFRHFGERIAQTLDTPRNGAVVAAATLCAGAVIPAMKAVFEGLPGQGPASTTDVVQPSGEQLAGRAIGNEIKLVSVMSTVEGEQVETRWGLHPRFRQDLKPEEARELSRLMNRIAQILGERYAAVAFSEDWATWHQTGHA